MDQTELVAELWRGPIVSAVQNPAVPNMLDVKIVIDDSVGNFVCREMGLFSEDGELIAICNTPDTEKVAISTGVDGRLTMVMHIVVADASVLEFTIIPALDVVSREDLERPPQLCHQLRLVHRGHIVAPTTVTGGGLGDFQLGARQNAGSDAGGPHGGDFRAVSFLNIRHFYCSSLYG